MWADPTTEVASTAPQNVEVGFEAPWVFPEDMEPNFPFGGESTAEGPHSNVPFDFSGQISTADPVQTCLALTADGLVPPADVPRENYSSDNTTNNPGPTAGDSSHTTDNSAAEESRPSLSYATSSGTNSTPSTDPIPLSNPYCACTLSGTCSHCRLKQRVARLQAESELLRATIEKARSVVSKHDEVLQDVHDSRRAPDSVMEELWRYQDELRQALSSCRE